MPFDLGPLGVQTNASAFFIGAGALYLVTILYSLTKFVLSTFVLPGKSLSSFGPKGSWAVVTGASDGVGKEFAFQTAAKGFNLILASRTKSKLDTLASQITSKYSNVKVETLPIDFSNPSEQDYQRLSALVEGKQVAVLINNVGQSHSIPVEFADTPLAEMQNIININCLATLRVTQLILPHMLPQKNGLVLTMGSFGGLTPTPLLATYSGSKAFLQQWSNALASELRPRGITVHFVQAYLITSAMSKIKRANWQTPSEKNFVRSALAKIGNECGSLGYSYSGSPYWSHAIVAYVVTQILGPMNKTLLEFNRKMHVGIRKRALKKAEREKAQGKKTS